MTTTTSTDDHDDQGELELARAAPAEQPPTDAAEHASRPATSPARTPGFRYDEPDSLYDTAGHEYAE